jgi:hypothetical protein
MKGMDNFLLPNETSKNTIKIKAGRKIKGRKGALETFISDFWMQVCP